MVKGSAEGIHVRPEVDRLLLHLFGGDVIGRTPDLACVLLHRRETEVHELRVAVRIKKDVFRLDVAVHASLVARTLKGLGDLLADLEDARDVSLPLVRVHERKKRPAGRQLHRDVGHPFADSVRIDLCDVRMDESRGGLRLLLELLDELGVVAELLQHHLDGDGAVEHLVSPHVNAAHATCAKLALQEEVVVLTEKARRLNERFAHRMILHPLKGQKTKEAQPRRFSTGTGPQ